MEASPEVCEDLCCRARPEHLERRSPENGQSQGQNLALTGVDAIRFRAKREQVERFYGLLPERQCKNLALSTLCTPHSLDSREERGGRGTVKARSYLFLFRSAAAGSTESKAPPVTSQISYANTYNLSTWFQSTLLHVCFNITNKDRSL